MLVKEAIVWEQRWDWLEREMRELSRRIGMLRILIRVVGYIMFTNVNVRRSIQLRFYAFYVNCTFLLKNEKNKMKGLHS